MSKNPEEIARRVLPWYLLPRFKNIVLSKRDVESYLVVNEVAREVFVPGASRFLTVPHVEFDAVDNKDEKKLLVHVHNGWIQGFLPNGQYAKFLAKTVLRDKDNEIEVKYDESYSDFAVSNVVRNYLRIKAGPLFAFKTEQYVKKYGIVFGRHSRDKVYSAEIIIKEKSAYSKITLPVFLYYMAYNGKIIDTVPGVVPGVLRAIGDGIIDPVAENPDAKQALTDFIRELTEVGQTLAPVSAATLQMTSKSKFTYIVGEADGPDTVFNELMKTGRRLVWITGAPAYKGTRVNFYIDPKNRKIYMTISILPFNAPAVLVLNYPPFSIAPLSALMNQRRLFLSYNLDKVERHLEKRGIKVGFYDVDYETLADAGVTFDEIRTALKEGYPKLDTLRQILGKMEKLGYIGDIISHAYGKEMKIEEILIKELKPLVAEKKPAEEKTVIPKEKEYEAEEEEVML